MASNTPSEHSQSLIPAPLNEASDTREHSKMASNSPSGNTRSPLPLMANNDSDAPEHSNMVSGSLAEDSRSMLPPSSKDDSDDTKHLHLHGHENGPDSSQLQHNTSSQPGDEDYDDVQSQDLASDIAEPSHSETDEPQDVAKLASDVVKGLELPQTSVSPPQQTTLTLPHHPHPRVSANNAGNTVTPLHQPVPLHPSRLSLTRLEEEARKNEAVKEDSDEDVVKACKKIIDKAIAEVEKKQPYLDPVTGYCYTPSVYSEHAIDDDSVDYDYKEEQATDLRRTAALMTPLNLRSPPSSARLLDRSRLLRRRAAAAWEETVTPVKWSTHGCKRLEEFAATVPDTPEGE